MLKSTMKRTAAATATGIAVTAMTVIAAAPLTGDVKIAGSSTVGPITMAISEAFRAEQPDVQVQNAVTGTGGGFKRFCVGETDISNASRPIKAAEYKTAKDNGIEFIEMPVAYDGLSICVNKARNRCCSVTLSTGPASLPWFDRHPTRLQTYTFFGKPLNHLGIGLALGFEYLSLNLFGTVV